MWQNDLKINKRLINMDIDFSNITKMRDSGEDWMDFEKMDDNLSAYIEKNEVNEDQLKLIVEQIINGLKVLHRYYIAHGYLNPQNILVKKEEENRIIIKITNFGSAKRYKVYGTPGYQAPELKNTLDIAFQRDMDQLEVLQQNIIQQQNEKIYNNLQQFDCQYGIKKEQNMQNIQQDSNKYPMTAGSSVFPQDENSEFENEEQNQSKSNDNQEYEDQNKNNNLSLAKQPLIQINGAVTQIELSQNLHKSEFIKAFEVIGNVINQSQ